MRVKKKKEMELKRKQKKIKKLAEITKERLKINPTYAYFKNPSEKAEISLQEVNQISTSITKVNCSLEKFIEKYKMPDLKSLNNLKTEVKEDIKKDFKYFTEMLSTAKNITKKVETVNEFLYPIGEGGNSEVEKFQDIIYYPTTSRNSITASSQPKKFKCLKCKKIFVLYFKNDENDMKKTLIKCHNVDKVFIDEHYRIYEF